MLKFCDACRQHRPLVDFDLNGDAPRMSTCRGCARNRAAYEAARRAHHAALATLERERRSMIVQLLKKEAQITALRASFVAPSVAARVALKEFLAEISS